MKIKITLDIPVEQILEEEFSISAENPTEKDIKSAVKCFLQRNDWNDNCDFRYEVKDEDIEIV